MSELQKIRRQEERYIKEKQAIILNIESFLNQLKATKKSIPLDVSMDECIEELEYIFAACINTTDPLHKDNLSPNASDDLKKEYLRRKVANLVSKNRKAAEDLRDSFKSSIDRINRAMLLREWLKIYNIMTEIELPLEYEIKNILRS